MNAPDVASELFDWLVDGAPGASQSPDVVQRVATDLNRAGVPIDQLGVFVTTLHPTVFGRRFRWMKDTNVVSTFELTAEIQASLVYTQSPVFRVTDGKVAFRCKLDEPLPADLPVLRELRDGGCTDYLGEPMIFTNGEVHAATFATKEPGGFTEAHLATIRRILRPLTRLAEIFALHRVAINLLSTYVGHNSGERILAGRILKGDVELVRAVIWFSDLRGFTEMSSRLEPREIIDALNELFECQVPAIEKRGGEVLKFIGDGLLGIFPCGDDAAKPCADALAAAADAFAALDARNATVAPKPPLQFGLALHVGEFAYGNIGGASRLDFTAIGPAVNIAARLEGLTGKLGRRVVVSRDFAKSAGGTFEDVGEFELKGVPGKQSVFGVAS